MWFNPRQASHCDVVHPFSANKKHPSVAKNICDNFVTTLPSRFRICIVMPKWPIHFTPFQMGHYDFGYYHVTWNRFGNSKMAHWCCSSRSNGPLWYSYIDFGPCRSTQRRNGQFESERNTKIVQWAILVSPLAYRYADLYTWQPRSQPFVQHRVDVVSWWHLTVFQWDEILIFVSDNNENPEAPLPRETIPLEQDLEQLETQLREVNANQEQLNKNFLELTEVLYFMTGFNNIGGSTLDWSIGFV